MSSGGKWTRKQQDEASELCKIINCPAASRLEKDIAQAKLDALDAETRKPPHVHKHRVKGTERGEVPGTSNILHNDEAFEIFEMGAEKHPHSRASKREELAVSDAQAIKMNHHAPGRVKQNTEKNIFEGFQE